MSIELEVEVERKNLRTRGYQEQIYTPQIGSKKIEFQLKFKTPQELDNIDTRAKPSKI